MAFRSWRGGITGSFDAASNWTPTGSPRPGDHLFIGDGNPIASNETLSKLSISIGGSAGTPGPAFVAYPIAGPEHAFNSWGFKPAPNPTLTLDTVTIDLDTSIDVPGVVFGKGLSATILIEGSVVNHGLIAVDGTNGFFGRAGTLDMSFARHDVDGHFTAADLTNWGEIDVGNGASLTFSGYALNGSIIEYPFAGFIVNNGTIDNGGHIFLQTNMSGTGTVNLNAAPSLLFGSAPSLFEIADIAPVGDDLHFVFNGGHLQLNNGVTFLATLEHFGATRTDQIEWAGYDFTAHSFADGVLTLTGINRDNTLGPFTEHLKFAGDYTADNFRLTPNADGTAISYVPTFAINPHLPHLPPIDVFGV